MKRTFFTSESVMEGHPDKLCDQIADGILDAILKEDPFARVACDVSASTGLITVFGQITTVSTVDIPAIVRSIIQAVGYTDSDFGIDGKACSVLIGLDRQSPDIAAGVGSSLEKRLGSDDEADQLGAGDQGLMFGYACKETPELMPLPIMLAHRLAKKVAELRKSGELLYLRPDGKTQVTVEYADGHVNRIEAVVIACQHDESVDQERIREDMLRMVIPAVIPAELLDDQTKYFVNATGRFVIGGPAGDSGWTGKKIIVDTYGGYARHGGGSFSGKERIIRLKRHGGNIDSSGKIDCFGTFRRRENNGILIQEGSIRFVSVTLLVPARSRIAPCAVGIPDQRLCIIPFPLVLHGHAGTVGNKQEIVRSQLTGGIGSRQCLIRVIPGLLLNTQGIQGCP